MKAEDLYAILERDFIKEDMKDDWQEEIYEIKEYVTENFLNRYMGLVCNFAEEINRVYTAVFPSKKVMQKILDDNAENAMLLCHHPAVWDIRLAPDVFSPMDKNYLEKFRKRNIPIYNLHVPLDDFNEYGTSVTLAKALGVKPVEPFGLYYGSFAGTFGKTDMTLEKLKEKFTEAVGHVVKLYNYGREIDDVAFIGGGGNQLDFLKEIKGKANTLVTGITLRNERSEGAHRFAQENKINLLGGTHYSTEKFSMIAMVDYFKNLGLNAEFVEDEPLLEDI